MPRRAPGARPGSTWWPRSCRWPPRWRRRELGQAHCPTRLTARPAHGATRPAVRTGLLFARGVFRAGGLTFPAASSRSSRRRQPRAPWRRRTPRSSAVPVAAPSAGTALKSTSASAVSSPPEFCTKASQRFNFPYVGASWVSPERLSDAESITLQGSGLRTFPMAPAWARSGADGLASGWRPVPVSCPVLQGPRRASPTASPATARTVAVIVSARRRPPTVRGSRSVSDGRASVRRSRSVSCEAPLHALTQVLLSPPLQQFVPSLPDDAHPALPDGLLQPVPAPDPVSGLRCHRHRPTPCPHRHTWSRAGHRVYSAAISRRRHRADRHRIPSGPVHALIPSNCRTQ